MRISDWSSDVCSSDLPLSTADIHITQRTGPNVGAINLVPPISVVVQDDPIDAMWARVVGTNDEVVMVVPVYVRDASAMYLEFGGGIELDARRAQPGDTLRLSTLQFTPPRDRKSVGWGKRVSIR